MAISITDEEWDALAPENFDTTALLRLHQLAMGVFNQGARGQVAELFESAVDLDDQVYDLMTSLKQVQETLSELSALYPESLSYGDLGDAD